MRTPQLLAEHGVRRAINVLIERGGDKLVKPHEHQELLTREMSHHVKNSLISVVGCCGSRLAAQSALEDAALRVGIIAQVHDHLWRGNQIGLIELADFIGELCKKLEKTALGHSVICDADPMMISADHAIPLFGLLVNELITNVVKYAHPDGLGAIRVSAREIEGHLQVEISDQGIGLPPDFDIDRPRKSLGFKVITGVNQRGVPTPIGELSR